MKQTGKKHLTNHCKNLTPAPEPDSERKQKFSSFRLKKHKNKQNHSLTRSSNSSSRRQGNLRAASGTEISIMTECATVVVVQMGKLCCHCPSFSFSVFCSRWSGHAMAPLVAAAVVGKREEWPDAVACRSKHPTTHIGQNKTHRLVVVVVPTHFTPKKKNWKIGEWTFEASRKTQPKKTEKEHTSQKCQKTEYWLKKSLPELQQYHTFAVSECCPKWQSSEID